MSLTALALVLLLLPLLVGIYAYFMYPALLWLVTRNRPAWVLPPEPEEWPIGTAATQRENWSAADSWPFTLILPCMTAVTRFR